MSINPQDEKKMIRLAIVVLILFLIVATFYWASLFRGLVNNP